MSGYTYTESSQRNYTGAPKIIQSRGSSSDSRSSHDSRGSTEQRQYTSSRTSMGYYGGSHSKVEEPKERRYRDPTADQKYVSSISRGDVEIIHQQKRRYDPEEPRSSDATSSHYKKTAHSSSRHSSSHTHSSRG